MSKILVSGCGYVGSAMMSLLDVQYKVEAHDPPKGMFSTSTKIEPWAAALICVPTPAHEDGWCDDSIVVDEYNRIRSIEPMMPILIKSTTSIETLRALDSVGDPYLTFSPEFLVARNALYTASRPEFAIYGGPSAMNIFWGNVFSECYSRDTVQPSVINLSTMAAAGFAKYTINSFLATKVTFFNEIRSLYDALSIEGDYKNVLKAITADPRIGRSHTEAPGPDGEYGWGGACFPKDTSEFVDLASRFDSPLNLLECAIELNREHRVKNK